MRHAQVRLGKIHNVAFAAFLVAIAVLVPAHPSRAQGLPQTQILPDSRGGGGRVRASILIPAPPEIVWNVMLDCANAPRFVPSLRACSIETQAPDGTSDVRVHRVAWLAGFPHVTIRFASTYRANREIRFERISGDVAQMTGVWLLEPRSNGQARLLPSTLVRGALKRDTPKILEAVRREAIARNTPR
jgi:ribosome-associated toxin RatA of RatAB toxin-antitoxin module